MQWNYLGNDVLFKTLYNMFIPAAHIFGEEILG